MGEWLLVITFHKLYHRHSERLSLRSSETNSHQERNIKALASLNPYPRLIDVLIWITIRRIPQIPVNTCVRSYVRLYTQKSLWERSPTSWIRMSPLLMPHIPQDKSDKTRESPTYWGIKELLIWWWSPTKAPHIPGWGGGGGESGFTLTGALCNFMFIPQELNEKGNSVDLSIRPK